MQKIVRCEQGNYHPFESPLVGSVNKIRTVSKNHVTPKNHVIPTLSEAKTEGPYDGESLLSNRRDIVPAAGIRTWVQGKAPAKASRDNMF